MTDRAPPIAWNCRTEVCFFTARDFHLSLEHGWKLIGCNDNGSGFYYAGLINRIFYEHSDLKRDPSIESPISVPEFGEQLIQTLRRE